MPGGTYFYVAGAIVERKRSDGTPSAELKNRCPTLSMIWLGASSAAGIQPQVESFT